MSGLIKKLKWTAVSSLQALHWSTLEQSGCLLLWVDSSCSSLMDPSAASTTTWPLDCLATARMSCWERLANTASWTGFFERKSNPSLLSLLFCCQQSVTFLMPGFYGWMSDSDRNDSHVEAGKTSASSKISGKSGEHLCTSWPYSTICYPCEWFNHLISYYQSKIRPHWWLEIWPWCIRLSWKGPQQVEARSLLETAPGWRNRPVLCQLFPPLQSPLHV